MGCYPRGGENHCIGPCNVAMILADDSYRLQRKP